MRLSSGVSEIGLQGVNPSAKIFVWPVYSDSKISNVKRINSQSAGEIYYTKATDEFREQMLDAIKNHSHSTYYNNGKPDLIAAGYEPGIFFDAFA